MAIGGARSGGRRRRREALRAGRRLADVRGVGRARAGARARRRGASRLAHEGGARLSRRSAPAGSGAEPSRRRHRPVARRSAAERAAGRNCTSTTGAPDLALPEFRRALEIAPLHGEALRGIGGAFIRTGVTDAGRFLDDVAAVGAGEAPAGKPMPPLIVKRPLDPSEWAIHFPRAATGPVHAMAEIARQLEPYAAGAARRDHRTDSARRPVAGSEPGVAARARGVHRARARADARLRRCAQRIATCACAPTRSWR